MIQRVSSVEDAVGDLEDNLIVQPVMRFIQVIPKDLQHCSSDEDWRIKANGSRTAAVLERQHAKAWGHP